MEVQAANEAATTEMKEPVSTTKMEEPTKGLGQVTMVDLKKHKQGKRLAEWNCQNKEKLKVQESESKLSQYYGTGAILAVGALGTLGYYVYQSKKGNVALVNPSDITLVRSHKFEME